MKYRLKKEFVKCLDGRGIIDENTRLSDEEYRKLALWTQDMFEPVNERIELIRTTGSLSFKDNVHWFVEKKEQRKAFTDDEIKKMEAALNNELYSEEDIMNVTMSKYLLRDIVGELKKRHA